MSKDYYFFFNKEDMPLAVFYTGFQEEAMFLFFILYKQKWKDSVKAGIYVMKEDNVPVEQWDRIGKKFYPQATIHAKEIPEWFRDKGNYEKEVMLETAKYLR